MMCATDASDADAQGEVVAPQKPGKGRSNRAGGPVTHESRAAVKGNLGDPL